MNVLIASCVLISVLISVPLSYAQGNGTGPFFPVDDEEMNINRLRTKLLWKQKYQRYSRPVKRHSTITNVSVGFYILNINSLSAMNQLLDLNGYLLVEWVDEHLTWDPSKFGGIQVLNFNFWEIWTPEVTHWNSAKGALSFYSINRSIRIRVNSTGHVIWDPDAAFTSPCDMDLSLYPFDTQYCTLVFGSWTYSSNQVKFSDASFVEHEWMNDNPEWQVIEIQMSRNDVDIIASKDHYSAISATIQMKRITNLYQYYIFIPYAVATAFILFSFFSPLSSAIRIIFPSMALMILFFLLIFLAVILVGTHSLNVPYAVKCVGANIMMVGFTLTMTQLNLNLIRKSTKLKAVTLPYSVDLILGNPIMVRLFCLPIKTSQSSSGNLINEDEDEEGLGSSPTIMQESRSDETEVSNPIVISEVVDRVLLSLYTLFVVLFHS